MWVIEPLWLQLAQMNDHVIWHVHPTPCIVFRRWLQVICHAYKHNIHECKMWLLFDSSFAISVMNQHQFNRDKCISERNLCSIFDCSSFATLFFFPSIKILYNVLIQCSYRILVFIDWVNNLHISYDFSHDILNLSQIWSTLKENYF